MRLMKSVKKVKKQWGRQFVANNPFDSGVVMLILVVTKYE